MGAPPHGEAANFTLVELNDQGSELGSLEAGCRCSAVQTSDGHIFTYPDPASAQNGQPAASLSPIDTSLYFAPGFAAQSYETAVSMLANPNLSLADRLVAGALAIAVAPLAGLEEVGRGILNVPADASIAGQLVARSNLQSDATAATVDRLSAVVFLATAFNNALAVGALAEGAVKVAGSAVGNSEAVTASDIPEVLSRTTTPYKDLGQTASVKTSEDLNSLFAELSKGGSAPVVKSYGTEVTLVDGTTVTLRPSSNSGGATIDINYKGSLGGTQGNFKVHIDNSHP